MKRLMGLLRGWAMRRFDLAPALPGPDGLTPYERMSLYRPGWEQRGALLAEIKAMDAMVLTEALACFHRLFMLEHADELVRISIPENEPRSYTESEALIYAAAHMRALLENVEDVLDTWNEENKNALRQIGREEAING